jgi:hypothetical protein
MKNIKVKIRIEFLILRLLSPHSTVYTLIQQTYKKLCSGYDILYSIVYILSSALCYVLTVRTLPFGNIS